MSFFSLNAEIPDKPRKRQLDDWDKSLFVWSDTDYRGFRSNARAKEEWTYDWLKDFDENVVFYDIGACVGSYSLMAAARGATVVAFEPLRENIRGLVRNVNLNGLEDKITIVEAAVSSEPAKMHVHPDMPAGYGLGSLVELEGKTEEVEVMTTSLDDAVKLYGQPTHIKVDVEGAEIQVFSGGRETFKHVQSVIVEIASDENEDVIDTWMAARDLAGHEVGERRTLENRTKIYERQA